MNRIFAGLIAGCGATLPMTLFMEAAHRWPKVEKEALPPRLLTEEVANRIDTDIEEPDLQSLTLLNHFAFGAVAGGLYARLLGDIKMHPILKGILWGIIVWSGSYLGWIPAARLLTPATHHTARRNVLMIAAHFVWGIGTALATEELRKRSNN